MNQAEVVLGLDIGGKRIGVARAHTAVRLATPLTIIEVNGREQDAIMRLVAQEQAERFVIGLPRNLDHEETPQTKAVKAYVEKMIVPLGLPISWQDEAGSSAVAIERMDRSSKFSHDDAHAAAIILQDYLDNL